MLSLHRVQGSSRHSAAVSTTGQQRRDSQPPSLHDQQLLCVVCPLLLQVWGDPVTDQSIIVEVTVSQPSAAAFSQAPHA